MEGIGYYGCGVVGVEGKVGGLCSLRSHHNEGGALPIENGDSGDGGEIGREGEGEEGRKEERKRERDKEREGYCMRKHDET